MEKHIRLHNKILNHWISSNVTHFFWWNYMLLQSDGKGLLKVSQNELLKELPECTKGKLRYFFDKLIADNMITVDGLNISITNYSKYQVATRTKVKKELSEEEAKSKSDAIELYNKLTVYFTESMLPKTDAIKEGWVSTLEKLLRIDNKDAETIEKAVKGAREHTEFWANNFLSLNKLRHKNREQVMYIDVFIARFVNVNNNTAVPLAEYEKADFKTFEERLKER